MKIYLVVHEGKIQWWKLAAWAEVERFGENGVSVKSVHAFTKKKYAKEWIQRNHADHLKIISVNLNEK